MTTHVANDAPITLTARTPCMLCGASDGAQITNRDGKTGEPLSVIACTACGAMRVDPLPDQEALDAFYRDRYREDYKGVTVPKIKHVYRAGQIALERYRWIRTHIGDNKRVVDIGAGGGEFIHLCRQRGHAASGVEPHAGYARHAQGAYDLDVVHGTVERITDLARPIEVVTMFHVLEHLRNPVSSLQVLHDCMSPGAHLFIEVPNGVCTECAPRRMFHRAHLHYFSSGTLARTVEKAGFSVQHVSGAGFEELVIRLVATKNVHPEPVPDPDAGEFDRAMFAAKRRSRPRYYAKHGYRRVGEMLLRELRESRLEKLYSDGAAVLRALYAERA